MINYIDVKKKLNFYYSLLLDEVFNTKKLNDFQMFFIKERKKQPHYKDLSYLDIYKKEYQRVDKITEEHVNRGVSDITKVFKNMNLQEDYISLAKVSYELHDIARRIQFMNTATVVDADSYDKELINKRNLYIEYPKGIINHATHGAYLLNNNNIFNYLEIPEEYREIISSSVKYHSNNKLPIKLNERVKDSLFDGKLLEKIITDDRYYPDLLRLYTQTVKSVDNFDLNNKVLLGAIPLIRDSFGLDIQEDDDIKDFVTLWGISENILREYNNLAKEETLQNKKVIYIPTKEVPIEKFQIPRHYMEMLINDTFPENLKEIQTRKDYNFLIAQLFRLSLLRNIEFKSLLQIVKDNNMLDNILDLYPEEFKSIMQPAFMFAKENIVEKALSESKSKIYTLSRKNK